MPLKNKKINIWKWEISGTWRNSQMPVMFWNSTIEYTIDRLPLAYDKPIKEGNETALGGF